MPNLLQGGPDRGFFEGSKPFVGMSLLFLGKRDSVQLPFVMFDDGVQGHGKVGNKHVRVQMESAGWRNMNPVDATADKNFRSGQV